MGDTAMPREGIVITLRDVWEQGQETRATVNDLVTSIGELVAVNKRLDAHHNTLELHDKRLDVLEIAKEVLAAQQRPKTPWYNVVGAVVGIVGGVGALLALVITLSQLTQALSAAG